MEDFGSIRGRERNDPAAESDQLPGLPPAGGVQKDDIPPADGPERLERARKLCLEIDVRLEAAPDALREGKGEVGHPAEYREVPRASRWVRAKASGRIA